MKVVVAIDSFKGSLTSLEAGRAAVVGIKNAAPNADVKLYPLADGGEGTCKTLTEGMGGEIKRVEVTGALGDKIFAEFGEVPEKNLAIIEMAAAAGLELVPKNRRNPLNTTTYGVGEMILRAGQDGCKNFIIGIGGSATNDCGLGMLTALGFHFYNSAGERCGIFGRDLADVRRIEISDVKLHGCKFQIACDVKNPLTGADGCSAVYAPQKGADSATVALMDGWIKNFGELAARTLNVKNISAAGDGAAGGLGFAFRNFLDGELVAGVDLILDALNISEDLRDADILITGEGKIDRQTLEGKAPAGVAKLAKNLNPKIKVVAIGGGVETGGGADIDAVFSILRAPMDLSAAMEKATAAENISAVVEQIIRLAGDFNG